MAQWNLLDVLPGGHRLFARPDSTAIYIADRSGKTPDLTDDGLLWLDQTRPLKIDGGHCVVPVVAESSSSYVVPVEAVDLLILSDRYRWPIACERNGVPVGNYRVVDLG
jgi:hypothetical protein